MSEIESKKTEDLGEQLGDLSPNQHRFMMPPDIYRVTAGQAGEAFFIDGGEKAVIYDCGMAYCHKGLIKNIEQKLRETGHEQLDMVFLSHSHYDHIGALPYVLKRWPDAQVLGAEKNARVFASQRARETMERLGEAAKEDFGDKDDKEPITTEGLRLDRTLEDGETVSIGKYTIKAIMTPGHTDCSISYLMEGVDHEVKTPSIFFLSESLGVLEDVEYLHTSMLKSYTQTIDSANKCKAVGADILIGSHYGVYPEEVKDKYFDMYIRFATEERDYILGMYDAGMTYEEMLEHYKEHYWQKTRDKAQPYEAFEENAGHTINCIISEFRGE